MLLRKRSEGTLDRPGREAAVDCASAGAGSGTLVYTNGRILRRRTATTASNGALSPSPPPPDGGALDRGDGPLQSNGHLPHTTSERLPRGVSEGRSASVGILGGGATSSSSLPQRLSPDGGAGGSLAPPQRVSQRLERDREAGAAAAAQSSDIVIHVCDEGRRIRRNFMCKQDVLLAHMKYFESHLAGATRNEDVEISVHCDVNVFEWLVAYMEDQSKVETLDENTVVSILISSEFLQMGALVDRCLEYMKKSINQVVRLPFDLRCLSNELVRRLAALLTDDELDLIRDKRDRLLSRLFAHKLEELLSDADNELHLCVYCRALFTATQRECTVCPKADIFIDFHGNAIAKHVADTDWDVGRYVRYCHEKLQLSWRAIYWRLWGRVQTLHCSTCQQYFCGAELEHCSYHPEAPNWHEAPNVHTGVFPCCKQSAVRFGTTVDVSGCCAREHVPSGSSPHADAGAAASILEKLQRRRSLVVVPFADRHHDPCAAAALRSPSPQGGRRSPSRLAFDEDEDEDEDPSSGRRGRTGSYDDEEEDDEEPWEGGAYSATLRRSRSVGFVVGGGMNVGGASAPAPEHRFYCFDPPPEHEHSLQTPARAGRAVQRARPRQRSKSRERLGKSASVDLTTIRRSCQAGCISPAAASSARGVEWPTPAPDGAPSFFNLPPPPNSSENKKRAFRMDMLKEDDRRRMDALVERIRTLRDSGRPAGAGGAAGGAGRGARRKAERRSLAWMGDAAAASSQGKQTSPMRPSLQTGAGTAAATASAAAAAAGANGTPGAVAGGCAAPNAVVAGSASGQRAAARAARAAASAAGGAGSSNRASSASGRRLRMERGSTGQRDLR